MTPKKLVADFLYKEECYAIIGACFEVYKDKGCGFHEPVYQECLGIEFEHCRIPAIAVPGLLLEYRGKLLQQKYFPDFVCYEKIIVELKAVIDLADEHRAQVLNYFESRPLRAWPAGEFRPLPKTAIRAPSQKSAET